nr:Rv3235 family protein [Actinotalea sp. Marseille-Q4924]
MDPPARGPEGLGTAGAPQAWSVRSPLTEVAWAPRPVATAAPEPLTDPGDLARAIVVTAVEVLAGARPLGQLVRWLTPELHEHLADRRAAIGPVAGTVRRASARRATVCRVSDDVAEVTVVVHDGRAVRAAAVRLEVHRRRWRASVLEIY